MNNYISASIDTLFSQAERTAEHYLILAKHMVTEKFDLKDHPEAQACLIAACMQTMTFDFSLAVLAKVIEDIEFQKSSD